MKAKNLPLKVAAIILLLLNTCTLGPSQGNLEVQVVDSESQPIEGATVTIQPEDTSKVTPSNGLVEFIDIDSGNHTVQVTKTGYAQYTSSVNVKSDKTTRHTATLSQRSH